MKNNSFLLFISISAVEMIILYYTSHYILIRQQVLYIALYTVVGCSTIQHLPFVSECYDLSTIHFILLRDLTYIVTVSFYGRAVWQTSAETCQASVQTGDNINKRAMIALNHSPGKTWLNGNKICIRQIGCTGCCPWKVNCNNRQS